MARHPGTGIGRYAAAAIFFVLAALDQAGAATALDAKHNFTISPQALAVALLTFSDQANIQVMTASADLVNVKSAGVSGKLTAREALSTLLHGTGLKFRVVSADAVAIEPNAERASQDAPRPEGQRDQDATLRMAQANSAGTNVHSTAQSSEPSARAGEDDKVQEIIVTAQKREERLIDTPQSVTVLSAEALAKLGATQFRDFANSVPGLSFQTTGAGATQVTLRGVTTGFDVGPTVAVYVDEVPYGSSSAFARGAQIALDVGLFDIDRIEVLRGPQGTLYGASTMGGLLKYVSKRPDTTRFSADVQTGISTTRSGGVGYNGAAAVNVPIAAGKAALHASGFYARDGGYIDNLAHGDEDADRGDMYGGRVDLLLTPSDALSIRLGGFFQDIVRDGQSTVEYTGAGAPQFGSLNQYRLFDEPSDQRFRLASATVNYDFGAATLTSVSSYQTIKSENVFDISAVYVPLLAGALGRSYSAVSDPPATDTDKFTQEVRLTSAAGRSLEWVVGAFYTKEDSEYTERFDLRDPTGAPAANDLYSFSGPSSYEEYAAFGDLTWHVTGKFNVTGGLRYAHNEQSFTQNGSGLFISSRPATRSDENVVTYLANARYQFSDRATGYVRYATGYRPGGPNLSANDPVTGLPLGKPTFDADRLKSYEIGFKAESAERRFGIDVAAYTIDWSNIQILAVRGGFALRANAPGGAKVRGTELSLTARPVPDLTLSGGFAYQDAKLSKADPDLGAAKGERLPNVPRFTASVNADYRLPGNLRPTVGASLRFMDERMASFDASTLPQYRLPDYTTLDLRTGFELNRFNVQVYVRNALDEEGQISSMLPQFGTRIAILQPRTVGVMLTTQF